MDPLDTWLDQLTGDAGQVGAFAGTWSNVSAELAGAADDLHRILGQDLSEMEGAAITAYVALQLDVVDHLHGASRWAAAMATALEVASTLVQIVHDLVRDAISQVLGAMVSYVAELVFTLGLATPVVIAQATSRAAAMASRIGRHVDALVTSFRNLDDLLRQLRRLLDQFTDSFARLLQGGPGPRPTMAGAGPGLGSGPGISVDSAGTHGTRSLPEPRPVHTPAPMTTTPTPKTSSSGGRGGLDLNLNELMSGESSVRSPGTPPSPFVRPGYEPGGRWSTPQARQAWVDEMKNGPEHHPKEAQTRRTVNNGSDWMDYQRRVAGDEEYLLRGGTDTIWADGLHIDADGVAAVEAKYVTAPGRSMYEGTAPARIQDTLMRQFDAEIRSYGEVIRSADSPVARLRIVASTQQAVDYLAERAHRLVPDIEIEAVLEL